MNTKVGIFDSGVGGKSVQNELDRLSKQLGVSLQIDYLADTENFPYGRKSKQDLKTIIRKNIEYLYSKGNSHIIVACNTASIAGSNVFESTQSTHAISITKVIDGVDLLKDELQYIDKVLVIGTEYTVASNYYLNKLREYNSQLQVIQAPMQDLIAYIELNNEKAIFDELLALKSLMLESKVDAILLGCTHYSFRREKFYDLIPNIAVIDPSTLTAVSFLKKLISKGNYQLSIDQENITQAFDLNLYGYNS